MTAKPARRGKIFPICNIVMVDEVDTGSVLVMLGTWVIVVVRPTGGARILFTTICAEI
jgi:hypothetical protein